MDNYKTVTPIRDRWLFTSFAAREKNLWYPGLVRDEPLEKLDQFSYVGNRARYRFIELDVSTQLDQQLRP